MAWAPSISCFGLLGVKEGLAAWVLGSFNVAAQPVRDQVLQMGGCGEPEGAAEDISVTPRSHKVLELALREAIILGGTTPTI